MKIVLDLTDEEARNFGMPSPAPYRKIAKQIREQIASPRPFVVLDLEDYDVPMMLRRLRGPANLNHLADQIEAQTKKPRPPEPTGLGAVVELATGYTWSRAVRTARNYNPWDWADSSGNGGSAQYADLGEVTEVLTEGWTE